MACGVRGCWDERKNRWRERKVLGNGWFWQGWGGKVRGEKRENGSGKTPHNHPCIFFFLAIYVRNPLSIYGMARHIPRADRCMIAAMRLYHQRTGKNSHGAHHGEAVAGQVQFDSAGSKEGECGQVEVLLRRADCRRGSKKCLDEEAELGRPKWQQLFSSQSVFGGFVYPSLFRAGECLL